MSTASNQIEVRSLENPKPTLGNSVVLILGLLTLGISVIFILSIVMIIPGIFGLLIGFFILRAGTPKVEFDCAACGQTVKVMAKEKSGVCEHCKTANPLVWPNPKNNKKVR